MSIGTRILERRRDLRLSQEELADRLGVARQTVLSWEGDKCLPDMVNFINMAQIFDCTVDALINPPQPSTPPATPTPEAATEGERAETEQGPDYKPAA